METNIFDADIHRLDGFPSKEVFKASLPVRLLLSRRAATDILPFFSPFAEICEQTNLDPHFYCLVH